MGALIDTNVVLDALAKREPWHRAASDLLFLAAQGKADLAVSGSTITDIYYLVNKHVYHDRRESLRVVRILLDSLSVVNVGLEECLMAAYSDLPDYEDAVVAQAARTAKLDYIITRNARHYEGSEVPPIAPQEYLDLIAPPVVPVVEGRAGAGAGGRPEA